MNNDYANGFKDGFKAGLEEGKKLNQKSYDPWAEPWPTTSPNISLHETCPKCGIKIGGAMGYVCQSVNCPSGFGPVTCDVSKPLTASRVGSAVGYTYGSGGAVGAVGSMSDNMGSWSKGPVGPTVDPETYNKVWVNGQWCELGN